MKQYGGENMKKFFQNIGDRMRRWMVGRYGNDELSTALYGVALVLMLLSFFQRLRLLYAPAIVLWVWSMFRCCSKNIENRRVERAAYLRFKERVSSWFDVRRRAWRERKTHRYYRCKQCRTVLRVPKGKGKIKVTCPHCHTETVKKT
jgi:LSD1 subclass zinc finger protein